VGWRLLKNDGMMGGGGDFGRDDAQATYFLVHEWPFINYRIALTRAVSYRRSRVLRSAGEKYDKSSQ
jgi:hypothetical protein